MVEKTYARMRGGEKTQLSYGRAVKATEKWRGENRHNTMQGNMVGLLNTKYKPNSKPAGHLLANPLTWN